MPTIVIQARAVTLSDVATNCNDILSSTNYRNGTKLTLTRNSTVVSTQTQSGGAYTQWSGIEVPTTNTYTISWDDDGASTIRSCLSYTGGNYFGRSSVTPDVPSTYTFTIGYGQPVGWYQTQGGDVYAANRIVSYIPTTASTRLFSVNGLPASNAYPGLITYGSASSTPYDFASSTGDDGSLFVSSKNWLVNNVFSPARDFYNYYFAGFGSPTTVDYPNPGSPISEPDPRETPYVVSGSMTTSGNWSVTSGQKLIFFVDGDLTIAGNMNISGTGIIVFVVKGDITVDPSVGTTYNSTVPVVEGVYLTNGAFHTGTSSVAGSERFVGKGMFIGNNFSFERDLSSVGENGTYAAELFVYNPQLFMELPTQMKETSITWQEVAP